LGLPVPWQPNKAPTAAHCQAFALCRMCLTSFCGAREIFAAHYLIVYYVVEKRHDSTILSFDVTRLADPKA
jgi:hypothetical protein